MIITRIVLLIIVMAFILTLATVELNYVSEDTAQHILAVLAGIAIGSLCTNIVDLMMASIFD